jgi:hypothetical protein
LPAKNIAVGAWRIMRKAALINENQRPSCFCVVFNFFLEGLPCGVARFGVSQAFFL